MTPLQAAATELMDAMVQTDFTCRLGEQLDALEKALESEQKQAATQVGEVVLFGNMDGLKEVSWLKGKMPRVGMKLFTHKPDESVQAPMTVEDIFRASKEFKSIYSLVPHQEVIAYTRAIEARCGVK